MAGITTFLTITYILAVNPQHLQQPRLDGHGHQRRLHSDSPYRHRGALSIMSLYAKKPFGLAPGMGLAFFVFTVCLTMGYPWQFASRQFSLRIHSLWC